MWAYAYSASWLPSPYDTRPVCIEPILEGRVYERVVRSGRISIDLTRIPPPDGGQMGLEAPAPAVLVVAVATLLCVGFKKKLLNSSLVIFVGRATSNGP